LECNRASRRRQVLRRGGRAGLLAALQEVNAEIAQKVEQAKTVVVAQATGLGKLRIVLPDGALQSLDGFRVVRKISEKVVKEGELPGADSTHPLMSGDYALTLLFANPNYQPPTEMPVGDFAVAKGATTEIALGALAFNVAEELKAAPVEAVVISESATGREALRLLRHDNDYYLFKPKPLLPGTYDVAFLYRRCEKPAVVAEGLAVAAGKETDLTLDPGIQVARPERTRVRGWDLVPAGGGEPGWPCAVAWTTTNRFGGRSSRAGTYDLISRSTTWTRTCRWARASRSGRARPCGSTPACSRRADRRADVEIVACALQAPRGWGRFPAT
jgi:hypothetical protein